MAFFYDWNDTDGQPWPSALFDVSVRIATVDHQDSEGRITYSGGSEWGRAILQDASTPLSLTNFRIEFTVTPSGVATNQWLVVSARGAGGWIASDAFVPDALFPSDGYMFRLRANNPQMYLYRAVGGTVTEIGGDDIAAYGIGTKWRIKIEVEGDDFRFKSWEDGTTEPGSWTQTHTDSTISDAGDVRVAFGSSGNGGGSTALFGPLTVTDLDSDPTYVLTTNTSGNGTVDRDPDAIEYEENAAVILTPVPDNLNWAFSHWTGDGITGTNENDDPLTYTMPGAAASVTAVFIEVVPLDTPVVTIDAQSNPTTVGGTDGTADASWPAVSEASTYRVEIAEGENATEGFTVLEEDHATTSYQATGLNAGPRTIGVTAKP